MILSKDLDRKSITVICEFTQGRNKITTKKGLELARKADFIKFNDANALYVLRWHEKKIYLISLRIKKEERMEKMNESIKKMGWKPFDDFVGKKGAWREMVRENEEILKPVLQRYKKWREKSRRGMVNFG